MLADAATAERAAFDRPFDVCVVGAGPAGITLAQRLAARGLDVALMEAGELDYCDDSQAFYAGEIVGLPQAPCEESRLRCFGGTSGHWEGKCRAFEAEDLAPRPWMPLSGWPIGLAELAPHAPEAAAILDLDACENPPDGPLAEPSDRFRHVVWRMSPPTRFGDKYRAEVIAAPRITLGVRATLVDLRLSDDARTVATGVFRAWGGLEPTFTVTARAFALCMGGLENARTLLNCRSRVAAGIGNGSDLVGRYFCDRPAVATGNLLLAEAIGHEERYFTPTPALAAEQGLARCALAIEPRAVHPGYSFLNLVSTTAGCIAPRIARMLDEIRDRRAASCYYGGLEEVAIRLAPDSHPVAVVGISLEQRLNPDSRVRLCHSTDPFGLHRVELDWRLTADDYRTMQTATVAFGGFLAEQGVGRLKVRDWLLEDDPRLPELGTGQGMIAGRQHMCTTRMSPSPAAGVVDTDCRIHGMTNLYVAGSSVFPTPGFAKPTFTIVQLALRLGDHMSAQLAPQL